MVIDLILVFITSGASIKEEMQVHILGAFVLKISLGCFF